MEEQVATHDASQSPATPIGQFIKPYFIYRRPEDDKVAVALQKAAAHCREKGLPLFGESDEKQEK